MNQKELTNNIPKDVVTSINKLKRIIQIIEENIHMPKDDILMEITIQLNITIGAARKMFSLYYPMKDTSLSKYITKRKRTEARKAIKNLKNKLLIDQVTREIAQCSRFYLHRMCNHDEPFTEVFDMDKVATKVGFVYDSLENLKKQGYLEVEIKRTKLNISNKDWNAGLGVIFSMREYILLDDYIVDGEIDISKLIISDISLECNEKNKSEVEYERGKRIMEFELYYSNPIIFRVKALTYCCVDREKYRSVIDTFKPPEDLSKFRSIIYKTKRTLKLLSRNEYEWISYAEKFLSMLDNEVEREVFIFIVSAESIDGYRGTIEDMYLELKLNIDELRKDDIYKAIKNLLLKNYISLIN